MQSLLLPIQFAFVSVPVRSLLSFFNYRRDIYLSSESQPKGKFPSETFIVVAFGNDGEKLRDRERERVIINWGFVYRLAGFWQGQKFPSAVWICS
jgi:hypothetical protein